MYLCFLADPSSAGENKPCAHVYVMYVLVPTEVTHEHLLQLFWLSPI